MHVGVGEFAVSNEKGGFLKTFALSSCVAVIMVAYTKHTAGLLHVALPESAMDLELAKERPGYFADTGIQALLREMERHGCRRSELVVKLVGGAGTIQPGLKSDIGRQNLQAVMDQLWRHKLGVLAMDVEADVVRTVTVLVETGAVLVSSPGRGKWEL
jgi:chemotaxis protein CheD